MGHLGTDQNAVVPGPHLIVFNAMVSQCIILCYLKERVKNLSRNYSGYCNIGLATFLEDIYFTAVIMSYRWFPYSICV